MAKLGVLAALLAALLVASAISARTTITTTVVEDDAETSIGRPKGESCQEQVQQQDHFNMCHRFLQEHSQGQGSYYGEVTMVTEQKGEDLKECCRQMENVQEKCRCEGLSMMMKHHQQQRRGSRQQQMEKMMAEKLPAMCDLSPKECQIESVVF